MPGFENYVFSIGAESRNSPPRFAAGYGYPIAAGTAWGGNIHLLHTKSHSLSEGSLDLAAEVTSAMPQARERGARRREQYLMLVISAATTAARAPPPWPPISCRRRLLRYGVNCVSRSRRACLRTCASACGRRPTTRHLPGAAERQEPEQLSRTSFTIPHAGTIIHAVGHQHTGAINISMWHNDRFVCASYPVTETKRTCRATGATTS